MRYCTNCGTQLPEHIRICPNCGSVIAPLPGATDPNAETIISSSSSTPVQTLASTDSAMYNPYLPHNTPPNIRLPNFTPQSPSQQSSLTASPSSSSYPMMPSPAPVAQPDKRKLSSGMIILIVVAALALMSSGGGILYYAAIARPAQLQAQATATILAFQANNDHATATAIAQENNQATATAQSYANATATAQGQAQATEEALKNIYTKATSSTPALDSSLASQTSSNWDIDQATGGGGCSFSGGAYHAAEVPQHFYFPCWAHATNFNNFALEVQMTIVKGDEGGVIFRANDANAQFYAFTVSQDGMYNLGISKDRTHSTSLLFDKSPQIKTGAGQTNTLTVIAQGSLIYLYINKQFVASTNDSAYGSGEIGVMCVNDTHPTDVAFSNLRIWQL